jgi:hypothetical protein
LSSAFRSARAKKRVIEFARVRPLARPVARPGPYCRLSSRFRAAPPSPSRPCGGAGAFVFSILAPLPRAAARRGLLRRGARRGLLRRGARRGLLRRGARRGLWVVRRFSLPACRPCSSGARSAVLPSRAAPPSLLPSSLSRLRLPLPLLRRLKFRGLKNARLLALLAGADRLPFPCCPSAVLLLFLLALLPSIKI